MDLATKPSGSAPEFGVGDANANCPLQIFKQIPPGIHQNTKFQAKNSVLFCWRAVASDGSHNQAFWIGLCVPNSRQIYAYGTSLYY